MGAIGRLFGLALVIAGLFIAVYWTIWIFMILVSKQIIFDITNNCVKWLFYNVIILTCFL